MFVSTATGSMTVPASPLLLGDTSDPILARNPPGSCDDSCPVAPCVPHDGHVALIIQLHELAPIVTNFLLS